MKSLVSQKHEPGRRHETSTYVGSLAGCATGLLENEWPESARPAPTDLWQDRRPNARNSVSIPWGGSGADSRAIHSGTYVLRRRLASAISDAAGDRSGSSNSSARILKQVMTAWALRRTVGGFPGQGVRSPATTRMLSWRARLSRSPCCPGELPAHIHGRRPEWGRTRRFVPPVWSRYFNHAAANLRRTRPI